MENSRLIIKNKVKKYNIKLRTTICPDAFYNNFRRVTKPAGRPWKVAYHAIVKAYIEESVDEMIYNNTEIYFPLIGKFRIQEKDCELVRKDGTTLLKRRIDWKTTKIMWLNKYPELTMDEILALPEKKKVLYFENENTGNAFYRVKWDKSTNLKNRTVLKFFTCNNVRKKLAEHIKDPNRKTQYYG